MTVIWCRTFSNSIHATHTNTIFKFIVGSIYLCLWPWARSHLHSVGPCPSHASFTARSSCPYMHGNSSLLGTNVTIHDHLSHSAPLACEGIPSIDFGIMKMMSTLIFVIWPGVVTLVSNEEEFPHKCGQEDQTMKEAWEGRANQMKMWIGPGRVFNVTLISENTYW